MNLEGIKGAAEDKKAIVAQRGHHSQSGEIADQVDLPDTRVVVDHLEAPNNCNRIKKSNRASTSLRRRKPAVAR